MHIGNDVRSLARAATSIVLATVLAAGLAPQSSYAESPAEFAGGGLYSVASESPAGGPSAQAQEIESETTTSAAGIAGAPLAAALVAGQTAVVRGDVALVAVDAEAEAVVGSFTVDGLTYAVDGAGEVALVAVAPMLASGLGEDIPDPVGASYVLAPYEGSAEGATPNSVILSGDAERSEASPFREGEVEVEGSLSLPPSVSYDGTDYELVRIAPLALAGAPIASVSIPETVRSIDSAAALGCEALTEVLVSEANPNFSTFDGYLTDKAQTSILLVPEGRIGQLRIPSSMQSVDPRVFSHCARITDLVVDADCPGLASWDGSLYTKDLAELVRVPAGVTELTLPAECASIGPSALSGCTELRSITALGVVTNIAPSAFGEIEEVEALPSEALAASTFGDAEVASAERPIQVTGLVAVASDALSSIQVDKSAITVTVPEGSDANAWQAAGFVTTYSSGSAVTLVQSETKDAYPYGGYIREIDNNSDKIRREISTAAPGSAAWGNADKLQSSDYLTSFSGLWAVAHAYSSTITWGYREDVGLWSYVPSLGKYYIFWNGKRGNILKDLRFSSGNAVNYGWSSSAASIYYFTFDGALDITWDAGSKGFLVDDGSDTGSSSQISQALYEETVDAPKLLNDRAKGYDLVGWSTDADASQDSEDLVVAGANLQVTEDATYYPVLRRVEYDLSFDVDSEPGDRDYPGNPKDDEAVNVDDGAIAIEDPKRPGYVFQGWVIPDAETGNKEALDQDLVYQGDDGKWYVDASKLPNYADSDAKVELTARWTSIISVDVPSTVTFYADTVTQGQESREGAVSGAFGQAEVINQSQVDLRVVGLESEAVETTDVTLGADSILKKAAAATPATSAQKLLSLYPSAKAWTAEELQDPSAVGGTKAATAVDFDLDDLLLEASFSAEDFTIPAGDTLNMGYRLNLTETGQELDYDKLSTLEDGQSAAIANVSYCFSADYNSPADWGEPLWIENPDRSSNPARFLLLDDIKAAAEDLSANGSGSEYYSLYQGLLNAQITNNGIAGSGPYFKVSIDGIYWDLQLIGICQDTKTAGGKAGLTFQLRDVFARSNTIGYPGNGVYASYVNASATTSGGWAMTYQRDSLRSTFWAFLDPKLQNCIVQVNKRQQVSGGVTASYLQATTGETVWLPSLYEVFGTSITYCNESEGLTNVAGYTPFQYMAYQPGGRGIPNACVIKNYFTDASSSLACTWWTRSAYRLTPTSSFCVATDAGRTAANTSSGTVDGVVPCFCL